MQHGDLETWSRTRILLVLEGVLATVTPVTETSRWGRRTSITGYDIEWHDVPLKRMITMAGQYDVAFDIVSFIHDHGVVDDAADYLQSIPIPYETIESANFKAFCSKLRFRVDVSQIIDSDPERLQHYGQLGRQVMIGGDF